MTNYTEMFYFHFLSFKFPFPDSFEKIQEAKSKLHVGYTLESLRSQSLPLLQGFGLNGLRWTRHCLLGFKDSQHFQCR